MVDFNCVELTIPENTIDLMYMGTRQDYDDLFCR